MGEHLRKLGLFCGTFNPIHSGHLLIAECARDQFSLERVFFVTSPSPPHRQDHDLLDAKARHDMVIAAVAGNPNFEASTVEIERAGLSYTIDTVEHFQNLYPEAKISLIIGGDNVKHLKDWHRADELFKQCHFLVAPRLVSTSADPDPAVDPDRSADPETSDAPDGCAEMTVTKQFKQDAFEMLGVPMSVIDFPGIAISASYIRQRLKNNQSVLYMVPLAVDTLLVKNKYYT
jgi:nicotinate-nucleotide adenylyltransferase